MSQPLLKYPPGSEWLYLKIYGGAYSIESWLTYEFYNLLISWRQSGVIDQFHFLHYLDPDYHIRVRLHLSNRRDCGVIMISLADTCESFLIQELFWKLEYATYEPDYERFGINVIQEVLEWFDADSEFWITVLKQMRDTDQSELWKVAIRSVFSFTQILDLELADRANLFSQIRKTNESFVGITPAMKIQMDQFYRNHCDEIRQLLEDEKSNPDPLLTSRSWKTRKLQDAMKQPDGDNKPIPSLELFADLIHFSLNRAFRTRHRQQELLVCYLLEQFLNSMMARNGNCSPLS